MLIDSHCHLPHKKYEKSIEEIIQDAKDFGVEKLITIGTSIKENELAIKTAKSYENVYCSVGVHPHEDIKTSLETISQSLKDNLNLSNKIIAIGECGVDISNWEGGRNLKDQLELFEVQLDVALQSKLPVIIHSRNGNDEVYALLNKYSKKGLLGVMHCFTSDWSYASKILDLGFYVSFTNMITYPKKDELLEVVKKVPMEKFLLETDAPYLPPQSHRGEINYPKYVRMVAEKVAQVKEIGFEQVCKASYKNTCELLIYD